MITNARRLSREASGDCPCGCGGTAYPYGCDELDGYVDAAPSCALDALSMAVEDDAPADE